MPPSSNASLHWEMDGDRTIAREMFTRLQRLWPHVTRTFPHEACLSLQANDMDVEMILSRRPWFQISGFSRFRMQCFAGDWHIDSDGILQWSELEQAQEFCQNLMDIWEQIMRSLEDES